ncbi:MAG: NADPH-dependent F420 reductase [Methanobacteriota archaeon]|nr:MAG: NADPH-dependent F420 reductase [Euryarchaeota archaeon]
MIGFIGGTGNQGRALALRLAAAGEEVILGSRTLQKAEKVVERIRAKRDGLRIRAGVNGDAAGGCDMVFVTLPYSSMKPALEPLRDALRGKVLVDVINPIAGNQVRREISASEELQALLPDSKVVCAFKNVSSVLLWDIERPVDVDSIVCSDHEDAKKRVIALSERMGVPAVDGGPLSNALASELLTRLLLELNRRYGVEAGVKIVSFKP